MIQTEKYLNVTIRSDGIDYTFKDVIEIQNLTNHTYVSENDYRIIYYITVDEGCIELETEITGKIVSKTRIVERKLNDRSGLILVDKNFKVLLNEIGTYDIGAEVCIFRDNVWKPVKVTQNSEDKYVIVYKDVD